MAIYYRGGNNVAPKPNEVRLDRTTGLLRTTHGISVFDRPDGLERFGGKHRVTAVPGDLRIVGQDRSYPSVICEEKRSAWRLTWSLLRSYFPKVLASGRNSRCLPRVICATWSFALRTVRNTNCSSPFRRVCNRTWRPTPRKAGTT